jgi:hypothetical protein
MMDELLHYYELVEVKLVLETKKIENQEVEMERRVRGLR